MRQLSIAACVVSAIVHGHLVTQHAASAPALAAAFLTATGALVVAAALLHSRTATATTAAGTTLLLVGLVAAYAIDGTVGLPLSVAHAAAHEEQLDALGLATKAIELLGAAAAFSLLFQNTAATVPADAPTKECEYRGRGGAAGRPSASSS